MYFKNEKMEKMFYLLELDGKVRMQKLKISAFMFSTPSASKKWYDDTMEILTSDNEDQELTQKAIDKLNSLYNEMN